MKSIRTKMFLMFGLPSVVLLLMFGVYSYFSIRNTVLPLTESFSQEVLNARSFEISRLVNGYEREVQALSELDVFRSGDINAVKADFDKRENKLNKDFENLSYVDLNGNSYNTAKATSNNTDRYYFKDIVIDKKNDIEITTPIISKTNGHKVFLIACAIKNYNNETSGLLLGTVNLDTMSSISSSIKILNNGYGWIMDNSGMVVAHPNEEYTMTLKLSELNKMGFGGTDELNKMVTSGQSGTTKITKPDGSTEVVMIKPIENTPNWILGISVPEKELLSKPNELLQKIYIILPSIILALIIMIRYVSFKITKPIKQLTSTVEEITSGDLSKRISVEGKDEVGQLASKFNNMIIKLNAAYNELEKKSMELETKNKEISTYSEKLEELVEERTTDYHKANTELVKKNEELLKTINILNETRNQLIQSEKMASLGSLVAGVAHEINTPLGIGITASSYIDKINNEFRKKLTEGQVTKNEFQKFMGNISDSISMLNINLNRAAELIKSFKQLAAEQTSDIKTTFSLKDNIEAVIISLRHEYKNKHVITNNCSESITLNSYPGMFSQIITNFIMNSLKHGFINEMKGNINISASIEGKIVKIIYTDDGAGISEENIKKIFEPFFTTNRKGGNSGLGLNIVYNIVSQRFKGNIYCESKYGFGVKFVIEIPKENVLYIKTNLLS